jgi:hypothetical protein
MVRYNHPVSADWLVVFVFEVGEQRLVGRLQKSFPEDSLELFARNVLWMIGKVKKDRFDKKVRFGGDVAVSALEGVLEIGKIVKRLKPLACRRRKRE